MCPCKGCEVRSENCHAKCEGYNAFRKDREKKAEARQKVKHIEMYMRDHRVFLIMVMVVLIPR